MSDEDGDEMAGLLDTIHRRFHLDFRGYAMSSLRRRLKAGAVSLGCASLAELDARLRDEPALFPQLMNYLTVQVSEMFRDPEFWRAVRREVVPRLATYPSFKVWIAGCSTGEEVWSLAILLREEGLLERARIYATDINTASLKRAEAGAFPLERMALFTRNHQASGARSSLSEHYQVHYGAALFNHSLCASVVFADHSLATDGVFSEMHFIICRNVLIYFLRPLQERALGLFADSLRPDGVLGLGPKETLSGSPLSGRFAELVPEQAIYRRRGP